MIKMWSDIAWDEYLYWQSHDKSVLKKINSLIKNIERNGVNKGTRHPEPLKYRKAWNRRIDHENRLVYNIINGNLWIASCKGHYED